jgi:hypothetical protein
MLSENFLNGHLHLLVCIRQKHIKWFILKKYAKTNCTLTPIYFL